MKSTLHPVLILFALSPAAFAQGGERGMGALNSNRPYGCFITGQLAGDLLPQPTPDHRIATGFSRNRVINGKGGFSDKEYRVRDLRILEAIHESAKQGGSKVPVTV